MENKTYLTDIPHEKGKLSFQHPVFKGTYSNIERQIDEAGLKRPNSSETASLIYDAFQNKKGKYEKEIRSILENNWFWEFTGNLYLPKSNEEVNNGVILYDASKDFNESKESLIKKLQGNDESVKFVPFGFETGEQNVFELMKNPYIKARYGEQGAEKIAKIASNYNKKPKLWSFDSVDKEIRRKSALINLWDFVDWLHVDGSNLYGNDNGRAFGVLPSEKV